ncbi:MAG: hypothetical protein KatS3mg032_1616 [Cyclobacteriaceae bacterium]|nr:MAG: hypothetical protein KatS3mg032_1616 [Cyclobacteriaceae bacterium]
MPAISRQNTLWHARKTIFYVMLFVVLANKDVKGQHNMVYASFGLGGKGFSFSALAGREWEIGEREKWVWGTGIRYTGYRGTDRFYATAPARLTTGSTGPLVLFKPNQPGNMDSIQVGVSSMHAVNLFVQIQYRIAQHWRAGFNIDVIGATLGAKQPATYINGPVREAAQAKPTSFNLLLVSDNDRGSLNSEFFVLYRPAGSLAVKGGVQFLFTEYTTTTRVQQLPEENNRFRNKSLMIALGVAKYFNP